MPESSSRVLVIEDETLLRLFLSVVLADEGFEVRTAADGCEALLILTSWRPVVILLDLQMPVMDGRVFRTEQRRIPSIADIPVLVVSAESNLEQQAAGLGATGSIAKPYDVDELLAAVNRVAVG